MLDKITGILAAKGCPTLVFGGVPKNPPVETVVEGIARMRDFAPDTVIGVGGGSASTPPKR
jgi:alcohol dehydrogenase class IV